MRCRSRWIKGRVRFSEQWITHFHFTSLQKSQRVKVKMSRSTYRCETRTFVDGVISTGRCFVIRIIGMHGFDIEVLSVRCRRSERTNEKVPFPMTTLTCLVPSFAVVAADNETSGHFGRVCDRTSSSSERFYLFQSWVQWHHRMDIPNQRLFLLAFEFYSKQNIQLHASAFSLTAV